MHFILSVGVPLLYHNARAFDATGRQMRVHSRSRKILMDVFAVYIVPYRNVARCFTGLVPGFLPLHLVRRLEKAELLTIFKIFLDFFRFFCGQPRHTPIMHAFKAKCSPRTLWPLTKLGWASQRCGRNSVKRVGHPRCARRARGGRKPKQGGPRRRKAPVGGSQPSTPPQAVCSTRRARGPEAIYYL